MISLVFHSTGKYVSDEHYQWWEDILPFESRFNYIFQSNNKKLLFLRIGEDDVKKYEKCNFNSYRIFCYIH